MKKNISDIIEKRRLELGLKDLDVADFIGVNIDYYCDIEWYDHEISTVALLQEAKKLFDILKLEFFEMVDMKCAFCELHKSIDQDYLLPRNKLIKKKRESLSLTRDGLGDHVGFSELAIEDMERNPNFLEEWSIDDILILAGVLAIPPQILFDVKCKKCHR